MICRSEVYASTLAAEAGFAGSVFTTAPVEFGSEGRLGPIEFVDVTLTLTSSLSGSKNGEALRLVIETKQKRLALMAASVPSQAESAA